MTRDPLVITIAVTIVTYLLIGLVIGIQRERSCARRQPQPLKHAVLCVLLVTLLWLPLLLQERDER